MTHAGFAQGGRMQIERNAPGAGNLLGNCAQLGGICKQPGDLVFILVRHEPVQAPCSGAAERRPLTDQPLGLRDRLHQLDEPESGAGDPEWACICAARTPATRRVSPSRLVLATQRSTSGPGAADGWAVAAAKAAGSATATLPHPKAAIFAATATPLRVMADSMAAADTGRRPADTPHPPPANW